MAGKFEIHTTSGGHRFNLKAGNGEIILTSENYTSREAAHKGAESVKNNASDDARFERKTGADGAAYFALKAANHEPIGTSERYSSKEAMEKGIESVKTNAAGAQIVDA